MPILGRTFWNRMPNLGGTIQKSCLATWKAKHFSNISAHWAFGRQAQTGTFVRCRGFSGVDVLSVEMSCLHWIWFSPYSGFQLNYTDIAFHPKSGFKTMLSTQTVVFTLNLISQKSYLPRQFLYSIEALLMPHHTITL